MGKGGRALMLPPPVGPILAEAYAQGLAHASGQSLWVWTERPWQWLLWNLAIAGALCEAERRGADTVRPQVSPLLGVVHILHHGRALCPLMEGPPSDWPSGHRWVSAVEAHLSNCLACSLQLPIDD